MKQSVYTRPIYAKILLIIHKYRYFWIIKGSFDLTLSTGLILMKLKTEEDDDKLQFLRQAYVHVYVLSYVYVSFQHPAAASYSLLVSLAR